MLGESLANKVTTAVSTDLGDAVEIGEQFDIVELPVHRGSDLAGTTLEDSGLREQAGVNVIGAWFDGEFESPLAPDAVIDRGTVLLVTGREQHLERLKQSTIGSMRPYARGETIVVGHGEVGRTVTAALQATDLPYTVVDREDLATVDIVGDATDPEVLQRAGIDDARTVILAVPDDTEAEFMTLVVRDLNAEIEIVARTERRESVGKMYRAGADYVLSLATVSGRMIASAVLENEDIMALDTQVEVIKTRAPGLAGTTLAAADVRAATGCTVVAVERHGEVLTDLGPEFRVRDDDQLVIAGTDEGVNRFAERFG
jgi:Trk K+ transport system NAD-binding subunit